MASGSRIAGPMACGRRIAEPVAVGMQGMWQSNCWPCGRRIPGTVAMDCCACGIADSGSQTDILIAHVLTPHVLSTPCCAASATACSQKAIAWLDVLSMVSRFGLNAATLINSMVAETCLVLMSLATLLTSTLVSPSPSPSPCSVRCKWQGPG